MILATIPLPKDLVVPPDVMEKARVSEIDITVKDVPLGAEEWITCSYALPHDDADDFYDSFFLTLCVVSSHVYGDAKALEPMAPVPPGSFIVTDPRCVHWLFDREQHLRPRARPWVGLQWVIDRRAAAREARRIVRQFEGAWRSVPDLDPRFSRWAPK